MAKERFETGKAPVIEVTLCGGDLAVNGWTEAAVVAKGNFEVVETDQGLRLTSTGDLRLSIPALAELKIDEVSGDLAIKDFAGSLAVAVVHGDAILVNGGSAELATVHGDLVVRGANGGTAAQLVHGDVAVRRCGGLQLQVVFGDCSVRSVKGEVTIGEASGDVDVRYVSGDVNISQTRRDANLADVGGMLTVGEAHGDIRLRGGLGSGDHVLRAKGDIVVRWPHGASMNLDAAAKRIDNRLALDDVTEKDGRLIGRIGESKLNLLLAADGRIVLRDAELVDEQWESFGGEEMGFDIGVDFGSIGAQIESEISQQMARLSRELETKFGKDFSDRLAEKLSRTAERAAEKMERRAERASERARARSGGFNFGASAMPTSPRKSVSPEEQLKILKMVETGAISSEEAGMLLEALEG